MPSPKIIGAVVIAAIAAGLVPGVPGVIGGSDGESGEALPAPPAILDVNSGEPNGPDDGYIRLIVTPTGGPDQAVAPTDASPTPTPEPTPRPTPEPTPAAVRDATPDTQAAAEIDSGSTEPLAGDDEPTEEALAGDAASRGREVDPNQIDAATLEQLTAGALLVFDDDGRPWAQYPDGTTVPLWRGSEVAVPPALAGESEPPKAAVDLPVPAAPPAELAFVIDGSEPVGAIPPDSVGHPLMDLVATLDEVARVVSIGDGTYAVTLVNPAVLDGLPLDIVDDAPMTLTADPYHGYQWALENTGDNLAGLSDPVTAQTSDADVDAAAALSGASGAGMVVAIIDAGVDFSHPDLRAAEWTNSFEECGNDIDDDNNGFVDDCVGWDFAGDDNEPFSPGTNPHGTHLAGIVAAAHNDLGIAGIAPKAQIMSLNVAMSDPEASTTVMTSAVARAIRYAVDNGAHIINLSLATAPNADRNDSDVLERAISYANDHNVLIVAAAGNNQANLSTTPVWPASYSSANLITVGSSDPSDGPSAFSNHGAGVDLFAPGELIVSTAPAEDGSYLFMSGTSQAAAAVSATAALVFDRTPTLTAAEVRDQLVASADRNDSLAGHVTNGLRLNAANAVGKGKPRFNIAAVRMSISGLAGAVEDDEIEFGLDIAVPDDHFAEPYRWEAALFTTVGDGSFAIIDHAVTVAGLADKTDARGAIEINIAGSGQAGWSTRLPAGEYQLTVEAVTADDPDSRFGDPLVVAFTVYERGDARQMGTTTAVATVDLLERVATPASEERETTVDPEGAAVDTEPAAPRPSGAASNDGWSLDTVSPRSAPSGSRAVVQLTGAFPEATYVWFGDVPGSVISRTSNELVVVAPDQATAGVVDLSLRRPGNHEPLTMIDGFTYLDAPAEPSGEMGTAGRVDDSAEAGIAPAPGATSADEGQDPVDPATLPQNKRHARVQLGEPFEVRPDMMGIRILGNDPRANAVHCASDPCSLL